MKIEVTEDELEIILDLLRSGITPNLVGPDRYDDANLIANWRTESPQHVERCLALNTEYDTREGLDLERQLVDAEADLLEKLTALGHAKEVCHA